MGLPILVVILGVCFFFSIVNFNFQKQRYRYSTKEEKQSLPFFKAPSTWLFCAILSALIMLGAFALSMSNIVNGLTGIQDSQNTINQYQQDQQNQQDTTDQNTDSSQTN